MKDQKNIWAWVGGAIVVIAIIFGIAWHFTKKSVTGPVAVHAPAGHIVAGFPQQLVLDTNIQVSNSYSINYSATTNQYTAEWNSSTTASIVYNDYLNYFKKNSWTITNQATSSEAYGIYADNASSTVFMLAFPDGKGSKVTITYLVK
jgi:hypothetical protein